MAEFKLSKKSSIKSNKSNWSRASSFASEDSGTWQGNAVHTVKVISIPSHDDTLGNEKHTGNFQKKSQVNLICVRSYFLTFCKYQIMYLLTYFHV